ncbi:MAG: helix-turn-helix transcriptional regulator [Clostridia bacterium]|jgi:transcriptional regulator with XRE-family HTH domain|nr:helix-turn-helix transcriptional regulator [Clostridia bacterium]MBQ5602644.1 helix-turn-helix transcriptional regulator [Clostridia bacterium]
MSNNIQEILISNLISLRKSRSLTQIELGEKINYSDKTISKWENGDSCPNIEAVHKLAKFYDVSIDDLLSEDFQIDKKIVAEKQRSYSKLIISLLAVMTVWLIATIIFVAISLLDVANAWMVFIIAVPESAIVSLVFNSIWGNTRFNYLIVSILLWTLLTTIFLSALKYASVLWVIFLIGVPIQIAIILWSQLKRKKKRAKQRKREDSVALTDSQGAPEDEE